MAIEIKVPPLAESINEASLLTWHVAEGQRVQRDDNLVDIETDKVVLEVPAPQAGTITRLLKAVGTALVSGDVLAYLEPEEGQPHDDAPPPIVSVNPPPTIDVAPVLAMPAAEKLMREQTLNPEGWVGTGRGGRILKEDVPTHGASPVSQASPSAVSAGEEQRVPMSPLRRRMAARLLQSQNQTATLTTFNEVDMSAILALRQRYKEAFEKKHGVRLGLMSFFVRAVCAALEQYPRLNSRIEGGDIVTPAQQHIGIAVGSRRGLLVPVLREAQAMTMAQIEQQIADFSRRADAGHVTPQELEGGTFSITNGGVFGSMLSTPIINPPQSAILGIHATRDRPVVVEGEIVIRPINYLALSYDHRLIDGREAVSALVTMKAWLEDPARALLEV